MQGYIEELEMLERGADAGERLRILLEWMLPLDPASLSAERGRVLMIAADGETSVRAFMNAIEERMTRLLREHLQPLIPADRVEAAADVLRALTNGIILSAVEHPKKWTPEQQRVTLDTVLIGLGLCASTSSLR